LRSIGRKTVERALESIAVLCLFYGIALVSFVLVKFADARWNAQQGRTSKRKFLVVAAQSALTAPLQLCFSDRAPPC
jgi:hypothetical protein